MTVTIRRICEIAALDLRVVAGSSGMDRPVRWVHVSETVDPTPWLRGGEFLLTTGMQLHLEPDLASYVHRLADAGLAGVGFGIGMQYDEIPHELRAAADDRELPLIEVPMQTPYVAISEAVSDMLTAERTADSARAFAGQQVLTRAALAGSASEIVRETARLLGGWCMQVDAAGRLVSASPVQAERHLASITTDIMRLRDGPARSATTVTADSTVAIQTLSTDRLARGFLVAGLPGPFGDYERMILSGAVALLSLETERSRSVSVRMHRARSDTLASILLSPLLPETAARHLGGWRLGAGALRVVVLLASHVGARRLYAQAVELLADRDAPGAATLVRYEDDSGVAVLLDTATEGDVVEALSEAARAAPGTFLGIGSTVPVDQVAESYRSALRAARVGRIESRAVTHVDDVRALELILRSGQPETIRAFVDEVLGPLALGRATGRETVLRQTLVAFLTHNGHWNDTAAALGVHRHTLRGRVEKIEQLTGRDLGSSYSRMEMWLALLAEGGQGLAAPARGPA